MDLNIIDWIWRKKCDPGKSRLFTEVQVAGPFMKSGVLVSKIFIKKFI